MYFIEQPVHGEFKFHAMEIVLKMLLLKNC